MVVSFSNNPNVSSAEVQRADASLALPIGRIIEISGAYAFGRTTLAVAAVVAAQQRDETCVWLQSQGGGLYPPDLSEAGVDLDALLVVHIPVAAGPFGIPKAAELLLRSGGFGLVVLDLRPVGVQCDKSARVLGVAWLGRLLSLAREHQSQVLVLTQSGSAEASLGPLVSLRLEVERQRVDQGLFSVLPRVLKDKSGFGSLGKLPLYRGPWGLQ
jgi:recombination protein RecA